MKNNALRQFATKLFKRKFELFLLFLVEEQKSSFKRNAKIRPVNVVMEATKTDDDKPLRIAERNRKCVRLEEQLEVVDIEQML